MNEEKNTKHSGSKVPPSEGFREAFLLHIADNHLILAQRNGEWCGHGPVLEHDIAITNISLDILGQARNFYQYVAALRNDGSTEDSLAYLRTEREFMNCLIVELPNGDWGQTLVRQFLFSAYHYFLYQQLQHCKNESIAAIAAKAIKEVTYHLRWSSEWVVRLGDGTEESHARMENAVAALWPYTDELFEVSDSDINIDHSLLKLEWDKKVAAVFEEATLTLPGKTFMHTGGRAGKHTEHFGFLLAEMQYMQRTYPNSEW